MRLFELHRDHDVSGVSGTGVVAEGVEFSDGTCVVRWVTDRGSTVVWRSIDDVEAIHGHGGATRVVWVESENGLRPRRIPRPTPTGRAPSEPAGR
jgi:hypothetical protein